MSVIRDEILVLKGALDRAAGELDEQLRFSSHLLGWMLEVEVGGSGELLDALDTLATRPQVRPSPMLAYLVSSDRLGGLGDLGLESEISRLVADTDASFEIGREAHERYLAALDAGMHPSVWQSRTGLGPIAGPVDFGAAMRALRNEGFEGELRHQMRALRDRALALRELSARIDPILRRIDERALP